MKKINFLFLSIIALLLFSCGNDEAINDPLKPGQPTTMTVHFDAKGVKAVGASPTLATETKIGTGIVMVFRGNGPGAMLDGIASFDFQGNAPTPVTVNVTAGPNRQVYVIANANPADFSLVNNVSDLYNITNKAITANIQTGSNLPMSGFVTGINTTSATSTPLTVPVTLSFVCAKVQMAWDISQLPANMAGFTVTDAYILNVKSQSDYFATTGGYYTDNVTSFLYGRSDVSAFSGATYYPFSTETNTNEVSLRLTDVTSNGNNFNNYFYVMENASATSPTIVVIEGEYSGTTYYYPIIINGTQNGSGTGGTTNPGGKSSKVIHGNAYKVKAIIKGFGNDNPYEPINKASIEVVITAASWTPINIDQEFN